MKYRYLAADNSKKGRNEFGDKDIINKRDAKKSYMERAFSHGCSSIDSCHMTQSPMH